MAIAKVIDFLDHLSLDRSPRPLTRLPRKSCFYLGCHEYTGGGPGLSWCAEYWVKRLKAGTQWSIIVKGEDTGERAEIGTFSSDEAKEYFEEVSFEIAHEKWIEMGWRPSRAGPSSEVIQLSDYTNYERVMNRARELPLPQGK